MKYRFLFLDSAPEFSQTLKRFIPGLFAWNVHWVLSDSISILFISSQDRLKINWDFINGSHTNNSSISCKFEFLLIADYLVAFRTAFAWRHCRRRWQHFSLSRSSFKSIIIEITMIKIIIIRMNIIVILLLLQIN